MTRWQRTAIGLGAIAMMSVGVPSLTQGQQQPAHVVMSSQQDRQRVMDELKITLFPSGAGAYLASTYDEATA